MFELKKIKVKDGKVTAIYKIPDTSNGSATKDLIELESDRIPHTDLTGALKALEMFLADSNDLRVHRKDLGLKKGDKTKLEAAEVALLKMDEIIYQSVKVSGVAIKGDDENRSIVITGKHEVHHTAVAMNSPSISLNGESFGWEETLKPIIDNVIEEARLYVIERKSSQLQMDFDKQETEEVVLEAV